MLTLIKLIKQTYRMAKPHERRVVMQNAASLSALQAITYLLPLLVIPYLFRVLGADKFGLIAFAQAFVQYFIILTNYGFNISATKEISLFRDNPAKISRAFSAVMIIKAWLTLISLILFILIVLFIPRFRQEWLVYAYSFGSVAGTVLFPAWFFQGTEKMKYITILNIVTGVFSAVFILLFVRHPGDYRLVPLINSLSLILLGLWGQYIVFTRFPVQFRWQASHHIRQQLKAGYNIFISVAAINAYTTARVFLLGLMTNNQITGFYSIAERIASACQTFPLDSFAQAIFPRLSKIFLRNKAKAARFMRHIQRITLMIALITLPLLFLAADGIIRIACGGNYPETVLTLRLLLVGVFFVSANAFRVQFLLVCGKTKVYSHIHVTMALIGLPLLFSLTYAFSYVGTAIATVVIEAGVLAMTYRAVKKLSFRK